MTRAVTELDLKVDSLSDQNNTCLAVIKEEMVAQKNNFEISILENSDKAVKKLQK